jgi:hypothetical protein
MCSYKQSTARIAIRVEEIPMERLALGRWEWEGGATSVGHTRPSVYRGRKEGWDRPAAYPVSETACDAGPSLGNENPAAKAARDEPR